MCLAPRGTDGFAGAVKGTCVTRRDESHDLPHFSFLQLPPRNILLPPSAMQNICEGTHALIQRHSRAFLSLNSSNDLILVRGSTRINSRSKAVWLQKNYWLTLNPYFCFFSFLSCPLQPCPLEPWIILLGPLPNLFCTI